MDKPVYKSLDNGYFIGPVVPEDRAAYIEHLKDKRIYDCTQNIPFPYTEADANWWLNRRVINPVQSKETLFAIRNPQSYLIGSIDAGSRFTVGQDQASEIGYWLAAPYWGKGIMTKAVSWLCDHAFKEFGLVRLTAHVFSFNQRSARVLEKNGFQLEAVLQNHHVKDGVFIDAHLYALMR